MTPNLRLNKSLTKKIQKIAKYKDPDMSMLRVNWALDNDNRLVGFSCNNLFAATLCLLQKVDEESYRLVEINNKLNCTFYYICDIEEFVKNSPIQIILIDGKKELKALKDMLTEQINFPSCGLVNCEEGEVYVYGHVYN